MGFPGFTGFYMKLLFSFLVNSLQRILTSLPGKGGHCNAVNQHFKSKGNLEFKYKVYILITSVTYLWQLSLYSISRKIIIMDLTFVKNSRENYMVLLNISFQPVFLLINLSQKNIAIVLTSL